MKLPTIIHTISEDLTKRHAKAIIVGGSVRDYLLGVATQDYDVEVHGINSIEMLKSILSKYGSVSLVGKQFGVLKFVYHGKEYDFSMPRSEIKVSSGHKGFEIITHKNIDFKETSKRRDFTINSMGYDIKSKHIIDPYNGAKDLQNRTLKHINSSTFTEDPLRVYRAVQFAARFNMKLDADTKILCSDMVASGMLDELPKERVFQEWQKLLLKSSKPSIGFKLMMELKIINKYFPEFQDMANCAHNLNINTEDNIWTHTMTSIDAMANILKNNNEKEKRKLILMLAVLLHKLDAISIELITRLTQEKKIKDGVLPLIMYHQKPFQLYTQNAKPKEIRQLSTKVNIEELVLIAEAIFMGLNTHNSKSKKYHAGEWLLGQARRLNVQNNPPTPFIQGRDLIDIGMKASQKFKKILDYLYEKQLAGEFNNKSEAIRYLKNYLHN